MGTFRTWMEKAYKVLEDKERQLANLNKLQGNTDDIKSFVSDVMTHGADLKFLTMSGQKFVDLSKVSCLSGFHRGMDSLRKRMLSDFPDVFKVDQQNFTRENKPPGYP